MPVDLGGFAQRRRCVLLTAGPGYGKTTALRTWLPAGSARWLEPSAVAATANGRRPEVSIDDGAAIEWLVLDDLPALPAEPAEALLAWIDALPAQLRVALASRWPLAAPLARWRGRGLLAQVLPADLALTVDQVAAVLRDDHDLRDPWLPTHLRNATGGWPALVHLAAETLRRRPSLTGEALLAALAEPQTAVCAYVAEEVLAGLPGDAVRLVLDLATFDPLSPELCRALGHPEAPLDLLSRTGLTEATDAGQYRIVPVVAAIARSIRPRERQPAQARLAAAWYEANGHPLAAARAQHEADDPHGCRALLVEHGEEILAAGGASAFIALARDLPGQLMTRRLRLLWGDALRIVGDVRTALAVFDDLAAQDPGPTWDPALAWRTGMVHYLRADLQAALEAFGRADCDGSSPADEVSVHAWTSTVYWMLGDAAAAMTHAERARERAPIAGDDRSLAAAHVAMAMALKLSGDFGGTDEHYAIALRFARRAGDLTQVTRILLNQSHEQLARAHYPQALEIATSAVRTAEGVGPAGMLIIAMCNEAEALGRVGRFDEAIERYGRIIAMCQRMGLRRTAAGLAGLGDVHRRRGWQEQARSAYEQAIAIARISGEQQALVPALAGLARIRVDDDLTAAAELADEAAGCAQGSLAMVARLAQGWVALANADPATAAGLADGVALEARPRQEPGLLAEALELRAASDVDIQAIRAGLIVAGAIWREAGATIDADRVLATLGGLPDAGTTERLAATQARQRQTAAGVRAQAATIPLGSGVAGARAVRIQVLGRFEVRVGGEPVPATAWQSRKARDLLRILVARRARVIAREELAELLWPEDDPSRTGHRLSVLLSLVRGVLDPDRSRPADQFILADKSGIALDPAGVHIDVEHFLSDVDHGCRLYEQGDLALAESVLRAAGRAYQGDPFDDEPYGDWTAPLRETARAAHLRSMRTLARIARHDGDVDRVVEHLLGILERDAYDEDAHRTLVSTLAGAGRHGEARRAHTRYEEAMRTVGAPPPDAAILINGA